MRKSTIMFLLSSLVVIFNVAPIVGHINNKTKRDSVKVDLIKAVPSPGVRTTIIYYTEPTVTPVATEIKKATDKPLKYSNYWVSASTLNVRKKPNKKSDVIDKLPYNTKVKVAVYNEQWMVLKDGGYISKEFLSNKKIKYTSYSMPYTNGFKSFMPHNLFSSKSSQSKLQLSCYTGKYGIRQYNGRYCVALGSHFKTDIGQYFDLVLNNGTVIPCIMADQKADCDTDSENIVTVANGCVTEFVVDYSSLNSEAKKMGDISYCTKEWRSRVVEVRVYEQTVN